MASEKGASRRRVIALLLAALVVCSTIMVLHHFYVTSKEQEGEGVEEIHPKQGVFGYVPPELRLTAEELEKLLKETALSWGEFVVTVKTAEYGRVSRALPIATPATTPSPPPGVPEYSPTNVQVAGVDEEDIVKCNGTHLFVARDDVVFVLAAYPPSGLKVLRCINVSADIERIIGPVELKVTIANRTITIAALRPHVQIQGLLLDEGAVIVLADVFFALPYPYPPPFHLVKGLRAKAGEAAPVPPAVPLIPVLKRTTWLLVYKGGRLVDYLWAEGWLVGARKVGARIVFVTASVPLLIKPLGLKPLPSTSWGTIPTESIAVIGKPEGYSVIVAYDVKTGERGAVSVAGPYASWIYMTPEGSVYIATSQAWIRRIGLEPLEGKSMIVLVKFEGVKPVVANKVIIDGRIPDQFAIDVYDDVLRVVAEHMVGGKLKVNVYTFDAESLQKLGELRGVAIDEAVHGVRFVGPRLYLVTYRYIDPLFTIDLSDPKNPKVLGYLKGPGFDEYLHPLNETAFIGIGRSENGTVRVTTYRVLPDGSIEVVSRVYTSMFWTPVFGPKGHHAVLVDLHHNIIALPVMGRLGNVVIIANRTSRIPPKIHKFESGVLVLNLDPRSLELGLRGFVRHKHALRQLYIEDVLYTVSEYSVKALDITTLKLITETKLAPP